MPRSISAFMGEERYLPDGSEQQFGTPRRPILNPLNNYPAAATDETSGAQNYSSPAVSSPASTGKRRVPSENMAILSVNTAPVAAVDTALNEPLKAPEPLAAVRDPAQQTTAFSEPVVLMKPASEQPVVATAAATSEAVSAEQAPVAQEWGVPAETKELPISAAPTVIKLIPPSSPKPGEQVLNASSMPAVAVVTKPAIDATQTAETETEQAEYPSLASIPEAPPATPAEKVAADIKSLDAERTESQSASEALLSNTSSTVMTSPETGKLVSDAATAMPTIEPAAGGKQAAGNDTSWLKNLLDPNEKKEAEEAEEAEETKKVAEISASAENANPAQDLTVPPVATVAPSTEVGTPVAMEQLAPSGPAEAAAVVAAANAAQAASVAPASVADTSSNTVQLRPPVTVAEAVVVKADQQLTEIVEQPVEDAQSAVKKVQYLPESRYAKRRLAPVNEAY